MKNKKTGQQNIYLELFWEFFKIGMFTIGGGMAMLPLIQQLVVDKGWLDEEESVDCVAISQALPGIIAINGATYVGRRIAGFGGALLATLGSVLPSFIIIIAAATLLENISGSGIIAGVFMGIKAAVCALMVLTAIRLGKNVLRDPVMWFLAIMAFVLIVFFDVAAVITIILGGLIGVIYQVFWKNRRAEG
ncbi:MAG: chromate transporter [Firmicutes bacterium]|nr:chromate transporter [Bacillota bacterium]